MGQKRSRDESNSPSSDSSQEELQEEEESGQHSEDESEETEGSFTEDGNYSECRVCGSSCGDLLCCETCPNVYHLTCTDPPLEVLPRGKWICPECEQVAELQKIERIVSSTKASSSGNNDDGSDTDDNFGIPHGRGVLVKWKEKSYIHASTLPMHLLLAAQKRFPSGLGQKVKKFLQDEEEREAQAQLAVASGLEANPAIEASWTVISRVLDEIKGRPIFQRQPGQRKYRARMSTHPAPREPSRFFVKWKGLPYQDCTWEDENDCRNRTDEDSFGAALSKYHSQRSISRFPFKWMDDKENLSSGQPNKDPAAPGVTYVASPSFLEGQLHPYQLEGLNWLLHAKQQGNHVILADEMGLGKTIQAIAYITAVMAKGATCPNLIVVPLSTLANWEREFEAWAPALNVVVLHGTATSRDIIKQYELFTGETQAQEDVKFHVLLISYETAIPEASLLKKLQWESLIVDEGHRLKNKKSRLFQVLKQVKVSHRVLLTGTPLQNNIAELFMLLHFLDNGKFGDLDEFEEQFQDLNHKDQVTQLHKQLKPHLLRRFKRDVLDELPPKREQIVRVELSPLQKDIYRQILTRNFSTLTANSKLTSSLTNILMELRKCCNHPYQIRGTEADYLAAKGISFASPRSEVLDALLEASGKLQLLDKMMPKLIERQHRVLIYSQFTQMLDILEDWLHERAWGYKRLDGDISGAERQSRIDDFNDHPEKFVCFLLSTRAGGVGINLATADTVITFDSDWNPHNDLQAHARAHRIGQQNPVMVYRLVTRATIEERMMQQAKDKLVLEHLVVQGMSGKSQMKQQDLDDLIKYGAAELFSNSNLPTSLQSGSTPEKAGASAKKRARISDAEREAGRTGGSFGPQIHYDDAAINRLLDRTNMVDDDADLPESDFMKAFKVASFETAEEPGSSSQQEPGDNKAFWQTLLADSVEQEKAAELLRLGKGMRERRKVDYTSQGIDDLDDKEGKASDDDDSKWSSAGEDSEDDKDWEVDALPEKPAEPKALANPQAAAHATPQATPLAIPQATPQATPQAIFHATTQATPQAVPQASPQAAPSHPKPEACILGFNYGERMQFIQSLMNFGLRQTRGSGAEDATYDWQHLAALMKDKLLIEVQAYGALVVKIMAEFGQAHYTSIIPEGFSVPDILGTYTPNMILSRLGMLMILHKLINGPETVHRQFLATNSYAAVPKLRYWTPNNDLALMKGIMKLGHGNWWRIANDSELKLMLPLEQEVGFAPPIPGSPTKEQIKAAKKRQQQHRTKVESFISTRMMLVIAALMQLHQGRQKHTSATGASHSQAIYPLDPSQPAQGTPAQGTPAQGMPAQGTPAQGTPAQGMPAQGTPAQGIFAQGTPAQGTPVARSAGPVQQPGRGAQHFQGNVSGQTPLQSLIRTSQGVYSGGQYAQQTSASGAQISKPKLVGSQSASIGPYTYHVSQYLNPSASSQPHSAQLAHARTPGSNYVPGYQQSQHNLSNPQPGYQQSPHNLSNPPPSYQQSQHNLSNPQPSLVYSRAANPALTPTVSQSIAYSRVSTQTHVTPQSLGIIMSASTGLQSLGAQSQPVQQARQSHSGPAAMQLQPLHHVARPSPPVQAARPSPAAQAARPSPQGQQPQGPGQHTQAARPSPQGQRPQGPGQHIQAARPSPQVQRPQGPGQHSVPLHQAATSSQAAPPARPSAYVKRPPGKGQFYVPLHPEPIQTVVPAARGQVRPGGRPPGGSAGQMAADSPHQSASSAQTVATSRPHQGPSAPRKAPETQAHPNSGKIHLSYDEIIKASDKQRVPNLTARDTAQASQTSPPPQSSGLSGGAVSSQQAMQQQPATSTQMAPLSSQDAHAANQRLQERRIAEHYIRSLMLAASSRKDSANTAAVAPTSPSTSGLSTRPAQSSHQPGSSSAPMTQPVPPQLPQEPQDLRPHQQSIDNPPASRPGAAPSLPQPSAHSPSELFPSGHQGLSQQLVTLDPKPAQAPVAPGSKSGMEGQPSVSPWIPSPPSDVIVLESSPENSDGDGAKQQTR